MNTEKINSIPIEAVNLILSNHKPLQFIDCSEITFPDCGHSYMLVFFLSEKGFDVQVFDDGNFCKDCSKAIKISIQEMMKVLEKKLENLKTKKE